MGKTIVVASGKGGTGKTMFAANIGGMLSQMGNNVCLIDMDTGLRNLDLYLGLENNVVYDVNDVLSGVCRIKQALIKDKAFPGLSFIAASPKKPDGEITPLHLKVLSDKLKKKFDYVIIDAPAGMEDGLNISLGGADEVIIVINPEIASLRDSSMVLEAIKDFKEKNKVAGLKVHYLLNKVDLELMEKGYVPTVEQFPSGIKERIIGIIEEDQNIHISTNLGTPVISMGDSKNYKNFMKIAERLSDL